MGFYATTTIPEKTAPLPKNSVGFFSASSRVRARRSSPQPLEPQQGKPPTLTETASGVRYYGLRYYTPELGRWVSRDPIEEQGGRNVYGFVANNAVINIDPHGRCIFWLSGDSEVSSAEDINVNVGGNGGGFARPSGAVSCNEGQVRIDIQLSIRISQTTYNRLVNSSGETVYYKPHNGTPDTFVTNLRRDAAIAHERGHASAFLEMRESIDEVLSYLCHCCVEEELFSLQTIVDIALDSAWQSPQHRPLTYDYADAATVGAHPTTDYDVTTNADGSYEFRKQ